MTERVQRLREALRVRQFSICVEKAQIITKSFAENDGWPQIIRRARATADYLDAKTIFIEPDELIIGNIASRPMGMELGSTGPGWPDDDLDDLLAGGQITISDEERKVLRSLDEYWLGKGRTQDEQQGLRYDDERLWPFMKRGFLCPPWMRKDQGRGQGSAGVGWGLGMGPTSLNCPDYEKVIMTGMGAIVEEAAERRRNLEIYSTDDVRKADFYEACLIVFPAMIRLANRFSNEAERLAGLEENEARKAELISIAQICRRVPEHPATTFREGVQAFFFYWLMVASATTPGGRFDQYMYPLYKADLEAGRITHKEALELLECLRLKIMQLNFVGGGKGQREKWAGLARWQNFIIGGCDEDGNDATNDLSYLLLEAAIETQTPHHTLTVRVGKNTPKELMMKSIEAVKTGMGLPAFISEDSYINFVQREGIDIREARKFAIAGCLDLMLPGASRNQAFGMAIVPMILELALYNGKEPKSGIQYGPQTGEIASFESFDEFYDAFLRQIHHVVGQIVEEHNILIVTQRDLYPDVVHSAFLRDGMEVGRDGLDRKMLLENGSAINVVGMANTVDSLVAVKKLVYDDKAVTAEQLLAALDANWKGYEDIHKLCQEAPKYGNNDAAADNLARRFWHDFSEIVRTFRSAFDGTVLPTAISISAHAPGGSMTGPTPDGRIDGETFADGSISPAQGRDKNGPLSVLQSGMKIAQDEYMATLLNMKFHPTALESEADMEKLADMVKTYLTAGGKQIQFNVVDKEMLIEAKVDKEKYRDLIVRVAGYSAYYTTLTERVQDELILRTEQML